MGLYVLLDEAKMLRLKPSVKLIKLQPQMLVAIYVVENACRQLGKDCVITSANDSTHGRFSLHYEGLGLDFRTKHLPPESKAAFVENVMSALPKDEWDVAFESAGTENEHLHVEWDPVR